MNSTSIVSVTLGVETIEEVDYFTSVVDIQSGPKHVNLRVAPFFTHVLSLKNKVGIFNTIVKAVLRSRATEDHKAYSHAPDVIETVLN